MLSFDPLDLKTFDCADLRFDPDLRSGLMALKYAYVCDVPKEEFSDAFHVARPERARDLMGTVAQVWLEEGEIKGEAQGIVKGKTETLLMLMERQFGPLSSETKARIQDGTPKDIDIWLKTFLKAGSVDAVFVSGGSH